MEGDPKGEKKIRGIKVVKDGEDEQNFLNQPIPLV